MKLCATLTSEQGKPMQKTGNEVINIQLTENREQRFSIMYDGSQMQILNFATGKIETVEYKS